MSPLVEEALRRALSYRGEGGVRVWEEMRDRLGPAEAQRLIALTHQNEFINVQEVAGDSEDLKWAIELMQAGSNYHFWRDAGFPLVRVSFDDGEALSRTDPPSWPVTSPHGNSEYAILGVEIGHYFGLIFNWRYGTCQWLHQAPPFDDEECHKRFVANVGFALLERPEGLEIREHRPSPKAMRKQGRKHYPTVQYIIQAARDLHPPPPDEERGHREEGWTQSVRTSVRGHWRLQPYGPGNRLRKVIWIRPFWRGPEDAPVSVHPIRLFKPGAT